jgi:hypothetical protein
VAVGRKGAHRGGQLMAAKSAAERWSTGVQRMAAGVDSRVGEQHGMTGKLAICMVPLEEVGG